MASCSHADQDIQFQHNILNILEQLYPIKETSAANYAYLYDRVAAAWINPTFRKPQRYGTQGKCIAPGVWEPIEIENSDTVNERRLSMGLVTLEEYIKWFKSICK